MSTSAQTMALHDGARVGIVGAGPAGTFTGYFLLEMAERRGVKLHVDIYDPKDFSRHGPQGCNHCAGIISEALVQALAAEGIDLPTDVVQRGIDSYVLHTVGEAVRLRAPLGEARLAALHRGKGPSGCQRMDWHWESFDGYLLKLATGKGARHLRQTVQRLAWQDGHPVLHTAQEAPQTYDFVVCATGVNADNDGLFAASELDHREPATAQAAIAEVFVGSDQVQACFGNAMHVFMLNLPGVEFAAMIPKGEYVTTCLIGEHVDRATLERFLALPEVRELLPVANGNRGLGCHCLPRINVGGGLPLAADRLVFVGDCGVSRLYKDGIGAAYRTAKACAVTAVFHGVGEQDFATWFLPTCRQLSRDNRLGALLFRAAGILRSHPRLRRAMLRLVRREQQRRPSPRTLSQILWDLFTGSATYRNILWRALNPVLGVRFAFACLAPPSRQTESA